MEKKHFESKNKSSKEAMGGLKGFAVKNYGFVIALVVVIVIIIVLAFAQYDPAASQEKATYAQQFYASNQSDFNSYLQNISDELAQTQKTTLDESYLLSTKSDIQWLTAKENTLYNSRPSSEVFPKEAAFTLFAQQITQINSDYTLDVGQTNYDEIITSGLALDYNVPQMLTAEELDSTFTTQKEKDVYFQTLNQLFGDYISTKKQFIRATMSKERQYVEAKKLVYLSFDNVKYPDTNNSDVGQIDGNI